MNHQICYNYKSLHRLREGKYTGKYSNFYDCHVTKIGLTQLERWLWQMQRIIAFNITQQTVQVTPYGKASHIPFMHVP